MHDILHFARTTRTQSHQTLFPLRLKGVANETRMTCVKIKIILNQYNTLTLIVAISDPPLDPPTFCIMWRVFVV